MKDEYLESLLEIIKSKKNDDPKLSYTALLHSKGLKEKARQKSNQIINNTILKRKGERNENGNRKENRTT